MGRGRRWSSVLGISRGSCLARAGRLLVHLGQSTCLSSYISRISFLYIIALWSALPRYLVDIFDLVVSRRHFYDFWPTTQRYHRPLLCYPKAQCLSSCFHTHMPAKHPSMVSIPSHQPSPTSPINIKPPSQPQLPPNQQPHRGRNIHHPPSHLRPPPRPPSTNRIKRTPPSRSRVRIPRRLRPPPPTRRRRRPLHGPLRLHKRRRRLHHWWRRRRR